MARDQGHVGEALHVLDEGGEATHAALVRARGRDDRTGVGIVGEVHGGRLLAGDVAIRREEEPNARPRPGVATTVFRLRAFGDRPLQGLRRGFVTLADVQHDLVGADGLGRKLRPVEHEVRAQEQERSILVAERLALGAVDEHDRPRPDAALGHGAPLPPDRETSATSSEQPARVELPDQAGAAADRGQPTQALDVGGIRFRAAAQGRPGEQARKERGLAHGQAPRPGSATEVSTLRFEPRA
jgi:hypothetical protein